MTPSFAVDSQTKTQEFFFLCDLNNKKNITEFPVISKPKYSKRLPLKKKFSSIFSWQGIWMKSFTVSYVFDSV